jgi:hypothetical protein
MLESDIYVVTSVIKTDKVVVRSWDDRESSTLTPPSG